MDMTAPGRHADNDSEYAWRQWTEKLRDTVERHRLWNDGDRIVIAVSGGPDSMLLLHAIAALTGHRPGSGQIIIAHVHHGFRPQESDEEARFVEREAERLGIRVAMKRVDAPGWAAEHKMNAQAAARQLRYDFLKEVAAREQAPIIALAHHADDQAETVLMRLLRGTGSTGLSGMAWKREADGFSFVRPLLGVRKAELLEWCRLRGIAYVTDSSNAKTDYLRNRVRLDVMPQLEQENPGLVASLCRTADVLREENDWIEEQARQLFQCVVKTVKDGEDVPMESSPPDGVVLDRRALLQAHVALQRRLIKLILNYLTREAEQADFDTVEALRNAAIREQPSTWKTDAVPGVEFRREYDRLLWLRQPIGQAKNGPDMLDLTIDRTYESGCLPIPSNGSTLHWVIKCDSGSSITQEAAHQAASGRRRVPSGQAEALFDAEQLCWPLRVRYRRDGDRMRILGLNGSKKVQDMFVDAKIAPSLRGTVPIVTDANGQILWVPGVRRSDAALVGPSTDRVLRLELEGGAHIPAQQQRSCSTQPNRMM